MKVVAILGLLIATSLAQLSYTQLSNGVANLGTLPPTTLGNNYATDLYSFFVPAGAQAVTVTFSNTNTQCSYLHLYIRTGGLPCDYNNYNSTFLCRNPADPGNGLSGTNAYTYQPGYSSDLFDFVENDNWYFGISRYSTYNTYACTYTLTVNYTLCPAGQVGNQLSSAPGDCAPLVSNVTLPYSTAFTNAAPTAVYINIWKFNVPYSTGHIQIDFRCDSTGAYVYGNSYAPASSSYYNCYTGSYTTNTDGTYSYSLVCQTPRSGDFYVTIYDNSGFSAATLNISATVCGAGMGGFNCTYPATFLDFSQNSTFSFTNTITPPATGVLTYPFAYYFTDIPMNYSGSPITVNLASTTGSAYLYIRVNGYPEDSSTYGYEDSSQYDSAPATFTINQYDFGRIYWGVECYSSSTACTYNLAVGRSAVVTSTSTSASVTSTSAAGMTSTSAAGMTSTSAAGMTSTSATSTSAAGMTSTSATGTSAAAGTSTSSAMVIVPSVVALIAMML